MGQLDEESELAARKLAMASSVFPERRLMPLRTRVFLEAMSALLENCPTPGD